MSRSLDLAGPLDAAMAWLGRSVLDSGEFSSFAGPLDVPTSEWTPDQLTFVTALSVELLASVSHELAAPLIDRGVAFLASQRERGSLWRYWSRSNERHDYTPPDADDTACCSIAVGVRGIDTSANRRVLLGCRTPEGRFRTWLTGPTRRPSLYARFVLAREMRPATRRAREELWANSEAEPDDVDAVVNANVCRYLGPERAPRGAVEWVARVVRDGAGTQDKWHRRPAMLWWSVSEGARRGITAFADLRTPVIDTVVSTIVEDLPAARSLDLGLSLVALLRFGAPAHLREVLAAELIERQEPAGCWGRDVVYFGGPLETFGWASEAFTTVAAVAALALQSEAAGA